MLLYFLPPASALLVAIFRLIEVRTSSRGTERGKVQETFTFRLFIMVGSGMTLGSILEYFLAHHAFHWEIYAVGVICALVSFKLRWAAIAALGKFWSLHVEMRENHEFVRSGPFRFVRHPTYFSMVLETVSFGLLCNAWFMLCIIPVVFIPAMWARLRVEERLLVEKFGDAYRGYQREVPMLIPYKWSSAK
jgi:protein-S-isoprenylcysteine O-methyltransferase Ste14